MGRGEHEGVCGFTSPFRSRECVNVTIKSKSGVCADLLLYICFCYLFRQFYIHADDGAHMHVPK